MGLIIQKTDFVGVFDLAKSINDHINSFIERNESDILVDLLGQELYDLFKASINPGPVDQIYQDLIDPLIPYTGCQLKSKGMKDMLLCLVWFEIVRSDGYRQSENGAVMNNSEVSSPLNLSFVFKNYNSGVGSYKAIQAYIRQNSEVYPTFSGVSKAYSSPF